MKLTAVIVALCATSASAYTSSFMGTQSAMRVNVGRSNLRMETFGFEFAEDAAAVALGEDSKLLGERRLKEQFIPEQQPRSLLTDDYPILERVGELSLLTRTAEAGILSALEEKGLTLGQLEALLPVIEKLGVLKLVQNPILYNLVLPLLIEPAPLLLGPLSGAIKAPATLWTGIAAICLALEAQGVVNDGSVSIPLLIPVVLFGGLGQLAAGNVGLPDVSNVPSPTFSAPSAPSLPSGSAPALPSFSAPALPSFSAPVPQGGGEVQTVSFDASGKRGGGGNKGLRI
uniref:Uncharacterized protein n=1 Tax=Florenciella parvula TaxID=236787 RepID=A0A7S2BDW8_9STRA